MNKINSFLLFVFSLITLSSVCNVVLADDDTITIGSILILTGEGSSWGVASKNGIEMAVKKVNAEGGINGKKLRVLHQDDQGDPKQAISAFRQLVHVSNVNIIIGPNWSSTGKAIMKLADSNKVLTISPTLGIADFNESSDLLFNTKVHDFLLSRELAHYVFNKGHKNIALIGAAEVWVEEQIKEFRETYESLGGKILILEQPLPGTTDVKSIALKIRNNKQVDALVSATNGVIIGSLVAKALMEMKVSLPMYSVILDQSAIDAAQGGFEGVEFITSLNPLPEFVKEYEETYNTHIDVGADGAYDATMLIAEAMRKTGSFDSQVLADYLNTIEKYDGVSGSLIADKKGGFEKKAVIMKVKEGKPILIK